MRTYTACGLCLWIASLGTASSAKSPPDSSSPGAVMPSFIEQFTADSGSLENTYSLSLSHTGMERFERFDTDELALLAGINFDALGAPDKIDYQLLKNRLTSDLHHLAIRKKQLREMEPLLPFCGTIETLVQDKRLMKRPDGEKAAAALSAMVK